MDAVQTDGVSNRALTDKDVVTRQYADDRNLAARQRLWQISRAEPGLDLHAWSVDLLEVTTGDAVLDAGCGNGRPLALLRERGIWAVGMDLSPGMALQAEHPQVAVGDVQHLPFDDGRFDAVGAFMMMYHVPDREAAAAELRRVAKPGGVVVATAPSTDNQAELRELVEGVVGDGWTWQRPSASGFHMESGADVLGTAFDSVEVVPAPEQRISITDLDALAEYLASSEDHWAGTLPDGWTWQAVIDGAQAAAAEVVEAEGALTVTAKIGAVVCR
jgi:SAM-dependent methyltransferase